MRYLVHHLVADAARTHPDDVAVVDRDRSLTYRQLDAVVAVPDELVTHRLVAYVTVRDQTTEQELARFCGERLPRYMVPESFTLLTELPKTSTGKIDRRKLQMSTQA